MNTEQESVSGKGWIVVKVDVVKMQLILNQVMDELYRAVEHYKPFPTPHHGYGIIKEELDEAWDEIKRNDPKRTREEMIQVASSAIRYLHDIE